MRTLATIALIAGCAGASWAGPAHDAWEFSATAYQYFVSDDHDYVQPTIAADRGRLHAELRYNYEDLETVSAWGGYTWEGGSDVAFEVTLMAGAIFGRTVGVAPGYAGSLSWRALVLSSEGEHFLDAENEYDSYFYSWSELTVSFSDVVRTGGALQRTRTYESPRDIQPGFLLGVDLDGWGIGAYVFNPDREATFVLTVYADI